MKSAVITFPGSNCDRDVFDALEKITGKKPIHVWHADATLPEVDLIVLPGGFSYGDYLRSGAMAARSPIMQDVKKAAAEGKFILGICNGFQMLTEMGLLPGTLQQNSHLRFTCKSVHIRVEHTNTPFTARYTEKEVISIPIAHMEGRYVADDATIQELENAGRILFRYTDAEGNEHENANPNGSMHHIAGITNKTRNVVGLMPHPERAIDAAYGREDGVRFFEGLL